jgi:hypothetical protein
MFRSYAKSLKSPSVPPFLLCLALALACGATQAAEVQAGKPLRLEGSIQFQDFKVGNDKYHVAVLELASPINVAKDVNGNGPSGDQSEVQVNIGSKITVWCGGKKRIMLKRQFLSQIDGKSLSLRGPVFNKDRAVHFKQAVVMPAEVWLNSCLP